MTTGDKVFGGRELKPRQTEIVAKAREAAGALWEIMNEVTHGAPGESQRLVALAKTNLEQAVMWFTKAVSREGDGK